MFNSIGIKHFNRIITFILIAFRAHKFLVPHKEFLMEKTFKRILNSRNSLTKRYFLDILDIYIQSKMCMKFKIYLVESKINFS